MDDFTPHQISKIQDIVNQTISQKIFRLPKIPPHEHDGVDNIQINKKNIIGNQINSGTITFEQQTTYTLAVNFVPKSIYIYGNVTYGSNIKGFIIGNALMGNGTYYMAPGTSTSTKVATTTQNIAQSSTYFLVDDTNSNAPVFHTLAGETHLIDIFYNSTVYIRGTVTSFSNGGVSIEFSTLASGWAVNANFVIT